MAAIYSAKLDEVADFPVFVAAAQKDAPLLASRRYSQSQKMQCNRDIVEIPDINN
jgi:hypothetical protein